jgi:peroxin-2
MGTEEGLERHRVSKGRVVVVPGLRLNIFNDVSRGALRICQTAVAPGGPTAMRPPEDPATQPASSTSASADVSAPNPPDVRVLRVSQIDAGRLDVELTSLLREQFLRIFSRVQPGAVARAAPELNLGLDALVFYFTVWSHRPTPGMALMNLRYRDERRVRGGKSGMEGERLTTSQRLAAFAALAGGRYAWAKLSRAASVGRWADEPTHTARHRAWRLIQVAELAHGAASLANFITFLRDGKFRSPWERAARARLVYAAPDAARVVSFEYLNRQLVWQELSELALFVLPIVSAHARRWREAARGGRRVSGGGGGAAALPSPRAPTPDGSAAGAEVRVPRAAPCVACARSPVTHPFVLEPCGHVVCYYCAAARAAKAQSDGARFRCAECGAAARGMRRAKHEARVSRE